MSLWGICTFWSTLEKLFNFAHTKNIPTTSKNNIMSRMMQIFSTLLPFISSFFYSLLLAFIDPSYTNEHILIYKAIFNLPPWYLCNFINVKNAGSYSFRSGPGEIWRLCMCQSWKTTRSPDGTLSRVPPRDPRRPRLPSVIAQELPLEFS